MPRIPDVKFEFYLVNFGYQVDIFRDGRKIAGICRDYGGGAESRGVHIDALLEELDVALARLRERFKDYPIKERSNNASRD
jgi:hypothetical protein